MEWMIGVFETQTPTKVSWQVEPYIVKETVYYMMAQWAEAVKDISELYKDALEVLKAQWTRRQKDDLAKAQENLGHMDEVLVEYLHGKGSGM